MPFLVKVKLSCSSPPALVQRTRSALTLPLMSPQVTLSLARTLPLTSPQRTLSFADTSPPTLPQVTLSLEKGKAHLFVFPALQRYKRMYQPSFLKKRHEKNPGISSQKNKI